MLADASSFLGSLFFAIAVGAVAFCAGYYLRGKKQF